MANFVDEAAERMMAELENEDWYHGALPLEDVVCLIAVRGDFLLRALEAEAGRGSMPCLTVRVENHVKDFPIHRIQQANAQMFTIDGVNKAPTAIALIQYVFHDLLTSTNNFVVKPRPVIATDKKFCSTNLFRKHFYNRIPIAGEVFLLKPIPKQAWELSKDKITMEQKIGEGAFGEVWRGTLRQFATMSVPVAIKVTKMKEENKAMMQEMHKEARLMRQYKHL
ncbi:hypothetical protein ANCDUO_15265 [Ancylostoma duodenale]|uniref:Non-specific protein-tyrosine kinase n=1 Tax=Ancylostoma duodenale TaxID=51022 RepID=A0A0C2CE38_9BILA|nr:hypothetical protein ANCDUO_15265 [Ancylostoma duodenale]